MNLHQRGHGWHLKINTAVTIVLSLIIVGGVLAVVRLNKKLNRFEIAQRVDPVRMFTIVTRIKQVNPKIAKREALEYARVIASQPQYLQPVAMAILEKENIPGYDMHHDGAAGEKGGMQLLPGTITILTRWTSYPEKEMATSIEANTIGGLVWWQMHYATYGNIAKAASAYNGIPKGIGFPTPYGKDIAKRVKEITAWVDSMDAVQLHEFNSQTR